MYPRDYFDTYWRTDLRDEVFVAMPFHEEFDPVWKQAIRPAVEEDSPSKLHACRVDASVLSGSVIVKILDGIAHARVILCDISVANTGRWKGQRNGNVMYEVGLAHAIRQSTEVALVRKDGEEINFDVAGISVQRYDADNLDEARRLFASLIAESLAQVEQEKSLKVQAAIDALDADCLRILEKHGGGPGFYDTADPGKGKTLQALSTSAAVSRLQVAGIARFEPRGVQGRPTYVWTEFGNAVLKRLRHK
jgi:hypothetical protein